jgi:hypothetical protein
LARRIISASRRSDIAAFYSRWLLRRLEEGFCEWIHPFTGRLERVSLLPQDCLAIVFWTRNSAPLLPALGDLEAAGHVPFFHFTVTGYPKPLESHNPELDLSLRRLRELAERVGPESVIWRYDPIVVSSVTPVAFHLERFASIAQRLEGVVRRVYFSFVDSYGKTRRNFERLRRAHGVRFLEPDAHERRDLAVLRGPAGGRRRGEGALHRPGSDPPPSLGCAGAAREAPDPRAMRLYGVGGHRRLRHLRLRLLLLLRDAEPRGRADEASRARPRGHRSMATAATAARGENRGVNSTRIFVAP